jgi:hypothetical protein
LVRALRKIVSSARIIAVEQFEWIARTALMTRKIQILLALAGAVALAGCESGKGVGGDPGARPLPAGQSCQTVRAELNKMDSQGAQSKVERANSGKADAATKAVADRYNQLLDQYLGARCHQ